MRCLEYTYTKQFSYNLNVTDFLGGTVVRKPPANQGMWV